MPPRNLDAPSHSTPNNPRLAQRHYRDDSSGCVANTEPCLTMCDVSDPFQPSPPKRSINPSRSVVMIKSSIAAMTQARDSRFLILSRMRTVSPDLTVSIPQRLTTVVPRSAGAARRVHLEEGQPVDGEGSTRPLVESGRATEDLPVNRKIATAAAARHAANIRM